LASFTFRCSVFTASASEGSCRSAVSSWLRYRATLAPHLIPANRAESHRGNHANHNETEGFHTAWTLSGRNPGRDSAPQQASDLKLANPLFCRSGREGADAICIANSCRSMRPSGLQRFSLKLSQPLRRHARACRGHPRLAFWRAAAKKDVDGRDKPGHDVEAMLNDRNLL